MMPMVPTMRPMIARADTLRCPPGIADDLDPPYRTMLLGGRWGRGRRADGAKLSRTLRPARRLCTHAADSLGRADQCIRTCSNMVTMASAAGRRSLHTADRFTRTRPGPSLSVEPLATGEIYLFTI